MLRQGLVIPIGYDADFSGFIGHVFPREQRVEAAFAAAEAAAVDEEFRGVGAGNGEHGFHCAGGIIPVADEMDAGLIFPSGLQGPIGFLRQADAVHLATGAGAVGRLAAAVGAVGKNPVGTARVIRLAAELGPPFDDGVGGEAFGIEVVSVLRRLFAKTAEIRRGKFIPHPARGFGAVVFRFHHWQIR